MFKRNKVKLTPLAMTKPNDKGVYSKSRIRSPEIITRSEFNSRFRGNSKSINVGDPDGKYSKQTAHGNGLDCWYLAEDA